MIAAAIATAAHFNLVKPYENKCRRCGKYGQVCEVTFFSADGAESTRTVLCPDCLRLVRTVLLAVLEPEVLQ